LSTAVVEVDTKVASARLTQNRCLQITMCNTVLIACWDTTTDRATPLNWTMMAWSSWAMSTTKQNRFYHFFRKRF